MVSYKKRHHTVRWNCLCQKRDKLDKHQERLQIGPHGFLSVKKIFLAFEKEHLISKPKDPSPALYVAPSLTTKALLATSIFNSDQL